MVSQDVLIECLESPDVAKSESGKLTSGSITDLATEIRSHPTSPKCQVVAISGFLGAGKSTVARELQAILDDAAIICVDDFIVDQLQGSLRCWNDIDWGRLVEEVLRPIQQGSDNIAYGVYDWTQNNITDSRALKVPKYLILEGVGLLRSELIQFYNCTVWLDVPFDVAMARGRKRDCEQYHIDFVQRWQDICSVNDNEYFELYRPLELADFILVNGTAD